MADVRPFRGLRFGPKAGPDLAALLAPPYDVISPQEQDALHESDPHNVVRLELGKAGPSDSDADNRYSRAKAALDAWLKEGVLLKEDRPSFYLCRHDYTYLGAKQNRWELLAQVRLAEWDEGVVLPHERTLPEPKVDRMNLLRALEANTSPIWVIYQDPKGDLRALFHRIASQRPTFAVPEWRDASFALWAVSDPESVAIIHTFLEPNPLYIADGHHRYETALSYRNEQRAAKPGYTGEEGFNFVFMTLTSLTDPGLLVLPIHRLIKDISPERMDILRREITTDWQVLGRISPGPFLEQQLPKVLTPSEGDIPRFGIYGIDPGQVTIITPKSLAALRAALPSSGSEAVRALDVTLLHEAFLHGALGIGREPREVEAALAFTHHAREAVDEVDAGRYQIALLMNPTRVSQIIAAAEAGDKMPQKSTFFYPKLPVGLVLSPLEEGRAN